MAKKFDEKEVFALIEQGVRDVYTSDNFSKYLKSLSKFHNYSLNNTMLILSQCPSASLVAGYSRWQNDFKRNVNKGEKAIKILAPFEVKYFETSPLYDDTGCVMVDHTGNELYISTERKVTKFRIVNVFDISQTSGEPLPSLVNELKGTNDTVKIFIESLKEICPIPILFKDINSDEILKDGAKGYYDKLNDMIVVNGELEDLQIAKTLAHEYAHSLLHKVTDKQQSQREIEAESLAFVLCHHFGLDTSDYSFGYIASYSNQDMSYLKHILENIQSYANKIITKIEPVFSRRRYEMLKDIMYISPLEMEQMSIGLIKELTKSISKLPVYNEIREYDADESEKNNFDMEISKLLSKLKNKYPIQYILYNENITYNESLNDSVYMECCKDVFRFDIERPFLEYSVERNNYKALESIAAPVLYNEAYYIKYGCFESQELHIERIGDDRVAMSHYYKLNGDMMANPDVEIVIDNENQLVYPKTYQQDGLQLYLNVDQQPKSAELLGLFVNSWIESIKDEGYRIREILTEDLELHQGKDDKEIYKYCKKYHIESLANKPKQKDIER